MTFAELAVGDQFTFADHPIPRAIYLKLCMADTGHPYRAGKAEKTTHKSGTVPPGINVQEWWSITVPAAAGVERRE